MVGILAARLNGGRERGAPAALVRFVNEADAIEAMGGFLIRVGRPGLVAGEHPSEQEQTRIVAHWTVRNEGDLLDLETALTSAFIFARHTGGIAA